MKMYYVSRQDRVADDLYQRAYVLIKGSPGTWTAFGAAFGLPAGLFCPVIGALLTVTAWSVKLHAFSSVLNVLSLISFMFTMPLLALGAHCLDLLEGKSLPPPPPSRCTTTLP